MSPGGSYLDISLNYPDITKLMNEASSRLRRANWKGETGEQRLRDAFSELELCKLDVDSLFDE